MLAGCCRPDGQCGLASDTLGLGCVARGDIPAALGGPLETMACAFGCDEDAECTGGGDNTVCAPPPSGEGRICVRRCERDQDCPGALVCGLQNDFRDNEVVAYCQRAIGGGVPFDFCSDAGDCAHGACVQFEGASEPVCTQLCRNAGDCSSNDCIDSRIFRPDQMGMQQFRICLSD
jgi:hypothetical protein